MLFLLYLLFCHWVGDFVLQSRWQAVNKSHDLRALTLHVLAYASTISVGVLLTGKFSLATVASFGLMNFGLHFVTDAFSSKVTKNLWSRGEIHNFFVIVGFDQFIHAASLVFTTILVLGVS